MNNIKNQKRRTAPRKVPIKHLLKLFSDPKLYIPKDKTTGKPTLSKPWYVYYCFRNPITNKLEKYQEKQGINRFKTIELRKKAGNVVRKALLKWLQEGGNPFELKKDKQDLTKKDSFSVKEALQLAFKEKCKVWSETSKDVNKTQYNVFLKWLTEKKLININIKELTKRHVVVFFKRINR